MSQRIFVAQPVRRAKRTMNKWIKRSVIAGMIFTAGLTLGNYSAHQQDAKNCHVINYTQRDYRHDVEDYGQKVADYNEGFATATTQCPK